MPKFPELSRAWNLRENYSSRHTYFGQICCKISVGTSQVLFVMQINCQWFFNITAEHSSHGKNCRKTSRKCPQSDSKQKMINEEFQKRYNFFPSVHDSMVVVLGSHKKLKIMRAIKTTRWKFRDRKKLIDNFFQSFLVAFDKISCGLFGKPVASCFWKNVIRDLLSWRVDSIVNAINHEINFVRFFDRKKWSSLKWFKRNWFEKKWKSLTRTFKLRNFLQILVIFLKNNLEVFIFKAFCKLWSFENF